jgi:hypothetical protein
MPEQLLSSDNMSTPNTVSEERLAALREERGRIYGESELSHENIGLAWTAAIQQHYGIRLPYPLKPWLVELMMGQFKIQRAVRVYHEDNYDDLANYAVKFAKEHQAKDPSAQLPK